MIVAVTGGTGFIGSKLVTKHVKLGDDVRVLSRRPQRRTVLSHDVTWRVGNLERSHDLIPFVDGADVLYHCAAEYRDSAKITAVNINGTENLAHAASNRIRHWVQLSSVGIYGNRTDGIITEETKMAPANLYEISKAKAEQIVIQSAAQNHFSYTILRPSNVYGIGMQGRGFYRLLSMISSGTFFFIGKPGASANYIHVDDVVEGLLRCGRIPSAKNGIFNISDNCTLEVFIELLASSLKKPIPHMRISEKWVRWIAKMTKYIPGNPLTEQRIDALVTRAIYSSEKIKRELGDWRFVDVECMFRELVENWLQENRRYRYSI